MQIILASQNKNKLKELSTIFQINSSKHSLVSPSRVLNVIEDKETIKENAEKKALEYFEFYDLPVIADDSGLFVDALNGAPGVHSARFSGENANDEKNNDKLLDLLQNNSNRSATFKTVLCFYDGKEFIYTLGELNGQILSSPRGENGFGYDPIFEVNGKTLAEMTLEEKSEISHRKNATIKMVELLNEIYNIIKISICFSYIFSM